jgi:hypothetical protein
MRSPEAQRWFARAEREFQVANVEAAHDSAKHALDLAPDDPEVRVLAGRIALARLELPEALRLLRGIEGSEATSLRARAYWYKGDLDRTAREVDRLLDDPDVHDGWAKSIGQLAHSGTGRKPFEVVTSDGRVEIVQMAKVAGAPLFVVPLEIDGEEALAMVSTGNAEVMLDGATRREPAWVSLRFGRRFEVKDVPAIPHDLTELTMRLGAPVKALIGANLLRRLNATIDLRGRQFVVRSFSPPPPPVATRVDVSYLRGGGMVVAGAFGEEDDRATLFVDTSMGHPLALDAAAWKRIGVDTQSLQPLPAPANELRGGSIPLLKLGGFSLPQIPSVFGAPITRIEKELGIDVDGAVGAGLLAAFRITFSEGGRVMWFEQRPGVPPLSDVPGLGSPLGGPDDLGPLLPPGAQPPSLLPGELPGDVPGLGPQPAPEER